MGIFVVGRLTAEDAGADDEDGGGPLLSFIALQHVLQTGLRSEAGDLDEVGGKDGGRWGT